MSLNAWFFQKLGMMCKTKWKQNKKVKYLNWESGSTFWIWHYQSMIWKKVGTGPCFCWHFTQCPNFLKKEMEFFLDMLKCTESKSPSDDKVDVCLSNRKCPTPGCDGSGHVTGRFTAHHCISGCPLAERNQGRLKADLSDSECKRNLFFGQRTKKTHYRGR